MSKEDATVAERPAGRSKLDWRQKIEGADLPHDEAQKLAEFAVVTKLQAARLLEEFVGAVNAAPHSDVAALPPEASKWSAKNVNEYRLGRRFAYGWDQLAKLHPEAFPKWRGHLASKWGSDAASRGADGKRTPWNGRVGWEDEPQLPINVQKRQDRQGATIEEPVEYGYLWYNRLVQEQHFRPFRTGSYEPRVAVPTEHGLEIYDPSVPEFVDRVGYSLCSLKGDPVPTRELTVAAKALVSRSLAQIGRAH